MLEKELQNIGLNAKEVKIYLASLELGQATVQHISKKSGINRATAYFIIDGLMSEGLMSSVYKGKKQYFIAADPDKLLILLEKRRSVIEAKENKLKKIMPQLKSINNKKHDMPIVRYYEGKAGIMTMVNEFMKSAKGIVTMAYSVDAVTSVFSKTERSGVREKRINKGIKTKVIYTMKNGKIRSTADGKRYKVPEGKFPISCDIAIYDNKVRISALGERLAGIIIEDREIANSLKAILDLAHEAAKKYDQKFSDK